MWLHNCSTDSLWTSTNSCLFLYSKLFNICTLNQINEKINILLIEGKQEEVRYLINTESKFQGDVCTYSNIGPDHPSEIHLNLGVRAVLDHFPPISAWHHFKKVRKRTYNKVSNIMFHVSLVYRKRTLHSM